MKVSVEFMTETSVLGSCSQSTLRMKLKALNACHDAVFFEN